MPEWTARHDAGLPRSTLDTALRERAAALGVSGYLSKPLDFDALLQHLAQACPGLDAPRTD